MILALTLVACCPLADEISACWIEGHYVARFQDVGLSRGQISHRQFPRVMTPDRESVQNLRAVIGLGNHGDCPPHLRRSFVGGLLDDLAYGWHAEVGCGCLIGVPLISDQSSQRAATDSRKPRHHRKSYAWRSATCSAPGSFVAKRFACERKIQWRRASNSGPSGATPVNGPKFAA